MAELTKEQITFLKRHSIAPAQIFDASTTKNKTARISQMDALELSFYFSGAACQKGGHTLRTKSGHCIQCDTSKIAYQLRHSSAGFVYLAYSKNNKLAKVGFTKSSPQDRAVILRKEQYANVSDWVIKRKFKFEKNAGREEFAIHSLLEDYLKPITYEKQRGIMVECREVFSCEIEVAIKAFDEVTNA